MRFRWRWRSRRWSCGLPLRRITTDHLAGVGDIGLHRTRCIPVLTPAMCVAVADHRPSFSLGHGFGPALPFLAPRGLSSSGFFPRPLPCPLRYLLLLPTLHSMYAPLRRYSPRFAHHL